MLAKMGKKRVNEIMHDEKRKIDENTAEVETENEYSDLFDRQLNGFRSICPMCSLSRIEP
jgi:hypothetical protein